MDTILPKTEARVRKTLQELQLRDKEDIPPAILNRLQAAYLTVPKGVDRDISRFFFTNILGFADSKTKGNYNVGLVFSRGVKHKLLGYHHCFVSEDMIDIVITGTTSYLAPLYLWRDDIFGYKAEENCTEEFRAFLNYAYPGYYVTLKEVFCYIYAVLHNRPYTTHYLDSIKRTQYLSFPIPKDPQLLLQLSDLGCMLMEFHLFNDTILHTHRLFYYKGYPEPEEWGQPILSLQTHYDADRQRVLLTNDYSLLGIRPEVYSYQLATVRPLHRYLRQRVGDPLTPEVFYHILDILIVINNALHFESLINSIDILRAPHYHPNHAALRRRARAHDTKNPTTGLFAF